MKPIPCHLLIIALLFSASAAIAKGQVAVSPQACPPDGYLKVRAPTKGDTNFPVKLENGIFRYCIQGRAQGALNGASCSVWGDATAFVRSQTGRTDIRYSGMGIRSWGDTDLYLFYCLSTENND